MTNIKLITTLTFLLFEFSTLAQNMDYVKGYRTFRKYNQIYGMVTGSEKYLVYTDAVKYEYVNHYQGPRGQKIIFDSGNITLLFPYDRLNDLRIALLEVKMKSHAWIETLNSSGFRDPVEKKMEIESKPYCAALVKIETGRIPCKENNLEFYFHASYDQSKRKYEYWIRMETNFPLNPINYPTIFIPGYFIQFNGDEEIDQWIDYLDQEKVDQFFLKQNKSQENSIENLLKN